MTAIVSLQLAFICLLLLTALEPQVLLFSMMGTQHARILQGHFNGIELVIHRSKLYDFQHENAALLEFFAQLFLSSPAGETKPE